MPVELRCKSWRCLRCAWSVARSDYARVQAGATSRPSWLYAVLTVDPKRHRDRWGAFIEAGELWRTKLQWRLDRAFGKTEYVQTWEQHRSGWPHVNVLFRSDGLLAEVARRGVETRTTDGPRGPRPARFPFYRREFARIVPECGFGERVWLELVDRPDGMAAYLCKVAGELTRAWIKDGDQRPVEAPKGFRRLRATRGLLPPRKTTGDYSGIMVRAPVETFVDEASGELRATWSDVERAWFAQADNEARAWFRRYSEPGRWPSLDRVPVA